MNDIRVKAHEQLKQIVEGNGYNNIEKSVYNWAIKNSTDLNIEANWNNENFVHMYVQRCMDVIHHIKEYELNEKIQNKEILSKDIGFFEHKNFNNDRWAPIVHETDETDKDGIFQCKKCNSKKTTYYSLQTRSADEPMTNFITCLTCGNRWKM